VDVVNGIRQDHKRHEKYIDVQQSHSCIIYYMLRMPKDELMHAMHINFSEDTGPVHPAYNPYFSACFFSWNSVFLSQQINQQCFSAGLSAQPNGAIASLPN
jgi:hypothetical protein